MLANRDAEKSIADWNAKPERSAPRGEIGVGEPHVADAPHHRRLAPRKGDARELAHRAPPSIAADEEPRGDLLGAEIGDHPVVARLDRAQRATSANVHVQLRSTFGEERL